MTVRVRRQAVASRYAAAGSFFVNLSEATSIAMITAPLFSEGHSSRLRDCQRSVVKELNDLLDRAATVGWSRPEVVVALADLLDAEAADESGLLRTMAAYSDRSAQSAA